MGLIQKFQRSQAGKLIERVARKWATWKFNMTMRFVHHLLQRCAPVKMKQVGTDKNGTLRQIKTLEYDIRKGEFKWKASKLRRGKPTNLHAKKRR